MTAIVRAVNLSWDLTKTSSFTLIPGVSFQIEAIGSAVDGALPATLKEGDEFTVHNSTISTQLVRVTNASYTIRGKGSTLLAGSNLILQVGDTVNLVVRSSLILEVV